MAKLLTSWELTPLFAAGSGFMGGGELEAGFLVIRAGKFYGWLSIFRVFWARTAPTSVVGWLWWAAIYASLALSATYLGNHGEFNVGIFIAAFLPLLVPVFKCVQSTNSQYEWAMRWCDNVVNAGKQGEERISRESIRQVVQTNNLKNLAEFKAMQQKLVVSMIESEHTMIASNPL